MSASDVQELLNTPILFVFAPLVNLAYLVGTNPFQYDFILALLAAASSASLYNILSGIPVNKAKEVRLLTTLAFVVSVLVWLAVLGASLYILIESFNKKTVVHEFLFFASVGVSLVVVSHILLMLEPVYQNRM